jgi:hypothetical protein
MADTPTQSNVINGKRYRPKSVTMTSSTFKNDGSLHSDCKGLNSTEAPSLSRHHQTSQRRSNTTMSSSLRHSHVSGHKSSDSSADAALLDAVCAGDDVTVLELLEGARHDCGTSSPRNIRGLVDAKHRPVLCLSVENSASPVIIKALLQHGADPDDRIPGTRQTALHLTAKLGYQV